MSRIGKIARLPTAVRDELNERLMEGEHQGQLVAWLNGREEVQAVLKAHYDGRAINDQNLSAWVQGGFEEWKHQQASLDLASRFVEDTAAVADVMAKQAGPEASAKGLLASFVTDRVAMMGALAMGELLMATRRMEDGAEKRRAILKTIRELVRLRTTDRQRERAQREEEQAERAAEVHEDWAERMRIRRSELAEPAPKRVWWTAEDELDETDDEAPTASTRADNAEGPKTEDREQRTEDGGQRPEHEHDYEQEHEGRAAGDRGQETDVRARMAEVIAGLSDAEIAESLRRSGYLRSTSTSTRVDGGQAPGTEGVSR